MSTAHDAARRRTRLKGRDRAAGAEADGNGVERGLARWAAWWSRPVAYHALLALVVVLAVAVRLPAVAEADDVFSGHADSGSYFNTAYHGFLNGRLHPMPHGGSGWPLLLGAAMSWAGIGGGDSLVMGQEAPADAAQAEAVLFAYAFHALLSAGLVAATYLLARQLVSPLMSLGAAALVAVDPFLLGQTTAVMADIPYAIVVLLAITCVLKARAHPRWLVAAGSLMAVAHMLRVNGLVMLLMVLAFAAVLLPRASERFSWRWLAAALIVFFVAAAPYLMWRGSHLPGPFDYGTNQRFFADDLWAEDHYWQTYTYEQGGERETLRDYLATHTMAEMLDRLYRSVHWQVLDFTGFGSGDEIANEGAALTPILLAFALVGWLAVAKRREFWFLPLALAFTLVTFLWIYPVVRSVRYYTPIVPMIAIVAVVGMREVGVRFGRPLLVTVSSLAAYLALYAVRPLEPVPDAIGFARGTGLAGLVVLMTTLWLLLAFAPSFAGAARGSGRRRGAHGSGDAASVAR